MATADPAPQQQASLSNPQPRSRRHRKPRQNPSAEPTNPETGLVEDNAPRRRTGGRAGPVRNGALALRPASVTPSLTTRPLIHPTIIEQSSGSEREPRQNPNRRRRGGGVAASSQATRVVNGRQFGGALTMNGDDDQESALSNELQADAPEFEPGQPIAAQPRSRGGPKQPQPRKRRPSRSTAPDIMTRIHQDIDACQYECAICTSEVLRRSKIWSCHMCWTVFHLDCIKKWASNAEKQAQEGARNGQTQQPFQWRCPGCNLPQDAKPSRYTCWCGKDDDPRSVTGLSPHSCGQTCGKGRVLPRKCPHPCDLPCHAGPCPPCSHMGPTQTCFCGKETSTRRCIDTDYEGGFSCGKICGDVMPCGEHTCERECHEGLCGACEVRLDARCYCGKEEKAILCCDKDDELASSRTHIAENGEVTTEEWTGMYQCAHFCQRFFDCGKHQCSKPCHTQEGGPDRCPRSPDVVTHCPCGKTSLAEISTKTRQTCEDPIANCKKVCLKPLPCGHPCRQICHTGDCWPCLEKVTIHCRCGRTALSTICHQGTVEPPQCTRICRITLNCGRHECGERCCPGERRATERQANKRKQRPLNAPSRTLEEYFEAEHICTRACGRLLKCGSHTCEELCHKGPCGACREAIFDEVSCHCGRTVLQPPLACGTQPPPCRFECERPKACGHPQVSHNCHQDEESCPRCPFFVEKSCMCGKKTLKNQPCYFNDVRCGEICGRKLKCGSHFCRRTCHRLGECEDSQGSCQQACGKPKKACGHPCEDICHAPYPCREEAACTHKIFITCECQHKKQEIRCAASKSNPTGNSGKSLKCDEECARLERNAKLALALDIDPATHTDDHIPYSNETLKLFTDNAKWGEEQEREFRVFASTEAEKRMRFKPMAAHQRSFLHALAEDFGLDSESLDPEPHRHVSVFKTPRFVSAPTKTLRDCMRIRQRETGPAQATAAHAGKAKPANALEPYNGLLLTNVRFALTLEEINTALVAALGPRSKLNFNVQFLASGDVALKATPTTSPAAQAAPTSDADRLFSTAISDAKPSIARAFNALSFGFLQLARFSDSLAVLARETDFARSSASAAAMVSEAGWSQVAARSAAPRRNLTSTSQTGDGGAAKNGFLVLGNLNAFKEANIAAAKKKEREREAKKKEKEEEERRRRMALVREESVVEDWEMAAEDDEEREGHGEKGPVEGEEASHAQIAAESFDGVVDGVTAIVSDGEVEMKQGSFSAITTLDEPADTVDKQDGDETAERTEKTDDVEDAARAEASEPPQVHAEAQAAESADIID